MEFQLFGKIHVKKLLRERCTVEFGDDLERGHFVEHIDETITAHNHHLAHGTVSTEQCPQIRRSNLFRNVIHKNGEKLRVGHINLLNGGINFYLCGCQKLFGTILQL